MRTLHLLHDEATCSDEQWSALHRIWTRWACFDATPFHEFLAHHVAPDHLMGCLMVRVHPCWGGDMWIGIEADGHTHS